MLDATTGQNGLAQAVAFHEAVGLTGIVLTKLDSTSKGGIVFAIEDALHIPVRFVGRRRAGGRPDRLRPRRVRRGALRLGADRTVALDLLDGLHRRGVERTGSSRSRRTGENQMIRIPMTPKSGASHIVVRSPIATARAPASERRD